MPNNLTGTTNFFTFTVKPTVDEFLNDLGNVRRGRLACIVLYHVADYWALGAHDKDFPIASLHKEITTLHKELILECPEFNLVRDVADASKHAQLSKQMAIPRVLSLSEQVTSSPGIFHAPFGEGVFSGASIVMVTLDDRTTHPLPDAVRSVLSMWERKVYPHKS
jgi:hypothetical protein